MGCCWSSGQEEDAWMGELQRQVEALPTRKEQEKLVLHYLTLFDEAKGRSQDKALATLAAVISHIDK